MAASYAFEDSMNSRASVKAIGTAGYGKTRYSWTVEWATDTAHVATGDDLLCFEDEQGALAALMGFLGATAEARWHGSPKSDNWHLFSEELAEWAVQMSDELCIAELELENY